MTTDGPDLKRLAEYVAARRNARRMSKDGAAAEARISRITWRKVEDGRPVRDTSYAAVEEALRWEPGSAARIMTGGDPVLMPEDSTATPDPDLVASAAKVLELVLAQFGPEVYEAAHEVIHGGRPNTDRSRDRRA